MQIIGIILFVYTKNYLVVVVRENSHYFFVLNCQLLKYLIIFAEHTKYFITVFNSMTDGNQARVPFWLNENSHREFYFRWLFLFYML